MKILTINQNILLILLFFSFMGYPLFLKFLFLKIYKVMIPLLILVLVFFVSFFNQKVNKVYYPFFILYFLYYLLVVFSSYGTVDGNTIVYMFNYLTKIFYLIILVLLINKQFILISLDWYAKLFTLLAIFAILLWILVFFNKIQPIGDLILSSNLLDDRIRQNYGIGFLWSSIPYYHFHISRLQSFSDEPGTFTFALTPAIFYTYYYKYKTMFYILIF